MSDKNIMLYCQSLNLLCLTIINIAFILNYNKFICINWILSIVQSMYFKKMKYKFRICAILIYINKLNLKKYKKKRSSIIVGIFHVVNFFSLRINKIYCLSIHNINNMKLITKKTQ